MTVKEFESLGPDHSLTIPNSVVDMFMGSLGQPPGGWPRRVKQVVLRGQQPRRGRPGANLPPADFEATSNQLEKKIRRTPSRTDVLSYLLYPQVSLDYDEFCKKYSHLEVIPTPQFFYGMKQGDEFAMDIEPGKRLIVKYLTMSEPHEDGTRTVFFELNGQPRSVTVRDLSLEVKTGPARKADPAHPGHVGAPIPGAVTSVAVELNQSVEKGEKLLVMEAMKMQSTVYAPVGGKVTQLPAHVGQQVEPKELLVVIE